MVRVFPAKTSLLLLISLLSTLLLPDATTASQEFHSMITGRTVPVIWRDLLTRLVEDGEDVSYMKALFSSSSVKFQAGVMPRKIVHDESKLHYDLFLKPARLKRAKKYLLENRTLLKKVAQQYGVPVEIMVAILLVETDLGNYLGSDSAFSILSSMAAATTIKHVRHLLPPKRLRGLDRKKVQKTLKRKSAWAYKELRALLKYASDNRMDILAMKGSIFGAIGLCQFMPSNILKLGIDFDRDGRIDVFQKPDALGSMANYLLHYGWKPGLSRKKQLEVIMHYNHSRPYATTVITVADRLKNTVK
jgi:membrane-bound lytic murein transglycosylase B